MESLVCNIQLNVIFCLNSRDINITAVDIDPSMLTVATNYFGLVPDNRLKVIIDDGVNFLKKTVKTGTQKNVFFKLLHLMEKIMKMIIFLIFIGQSFKAILFDVDSKNPSVGMSCPPVQFLEQDVLDTVKLCIGDNGK